MVPRRSAMLTIVAEQTKKAEAEVAEFMAIPKPSGEIELATQLKNTGNSTIRANLAIEIRKASGQETVAKLSQSEDVTAPLLAGCGLTIKQGFNQILEPGRYMAMLTLRYDPQNPPLVAQTAFDVESRAIAASGPAATAPMVEETAMVEAASSGE